MEMTGLIRRAVMAGVASALELAVLGCGAQHANVASVGTSSSSGNAPTTVAGAGNDVGAYVDGMRKWVSCMRQQGVDVSDPDATGVVTFPGDSASQKSDPKIVSAQEKCNSMRPAVPESVLDLRRPKLSPEQIETRRKYAACIQAKGAPDFPGPGPDGYPPRDKTWDETTPGAQTARRACATIIGDPTVPSTTHG